jgi:cytoskeletal protein CcmA (bactofilin family)
LAGSRIAAAYDRAVAERAGQEGCVSYFTASKNDRDIREPAEAPRLQPAVSARPASPAQTNVSTLASGMHVIGNIVCAGPLQIHGRVNGDIHAAQLTICEGARVEGKIIAPEAVIEGSFNGSIHGNVVKLQKTASVEGEIYNKSLAIEQDARFEGIARRIDQPVAAPTSEQAAGVNGRLQGAAGNGAAANGGGFAPAPLELRPEQQAPPVSPAV